VVPVLGQPMSPPTVLAQCGLRLISGIRVAGNQSKRLNDNSRRCGGKTRLMGLMCICAGFMRV
jgi:hypothetical protein